METKYKEVDRQTTAVCVNCKTQREEELSQFDRKLSAATRKVALLTAITCVFCVLAVSAAGCGVYFYFEIQTFRAELIGIARRADVDGGSGVVASGFDAMTMYDDDSASDDDVDINASLKDIIGARERRRKPNSKNKKGGGSGGGNKKACKTNKALVKCTEKRVIRSLTRKGGYLSTIKASNPPPKPTTTTTTPKPTVQEDTSLPKSPLSYVSAAHYTSFVDDEYIKTHMGETDHGRLDGFNDLCKNITEWHGQLCRNRTFTATDAPVTLKIFKESSWMNNSASDKLFELKDDGTFVARHTGIYLLYAHVLFYDSKTKQAMGLLHESGGIETNMFRCMQSVDHVDPSLPTGQNNRYKSCSVSGVLFVNKHDTIKVQNLYAHTNIDLSKDVTYFGALRFFSSAMESS